MENLSDQQKFLLKLGGVLAFSLGGWIVTLQTWQSSLTPVAFGGLLIILGSQLLGVLGIVPPSAQRNVDIALVSGVHTRNEVEAIARATEPGTVPTPEVAAAILAKPKEVAPENIKEN